MGLIDMMRKFDAMRLHGQDMLHREIDTGAFAG